MPLPVDLAALKAQLRLDAGSTDEDVMLAALLATSVRMAEALLDRPIDDTRLSNDDRQVIGQAVLVLATSLYEDRDGTKDMPRAVGALLRPFRDLSR